MDLRDHVNKFPYGQMWSLDYNGQTVIARKDFHSWTYRGGKLIEGICLPGITIYSPKPAALGAAGLAADDLTTPDPTAAMWSVPPESTDWRLVAVSGVAIVAITAAFLLAIRAAGNARRRPARLR
jgi:hypothetical protein